MSDKEFEVLETVMSPIVSQTEDQVLKALWFLELFSSFHFIFTILFYWTEFPSALFTSSEASRPACNFICNLDT